MNNNEENKIIVTQGQLDVEKARPFILIRFIKDFLNYIGIRFRQITLFTWSLFISSASCFNAVKQWSIRRIYWGRGSLYRTAFHIIVFVMTIAGFFIGISSRINLFKTNEQLGLVLASGVIGNADTLYQAGTAETITPIDPYSKNWPEFKYVVQAGDTLQKIADLYGVSTATIQWANNLYTDNLRVGQLLIVPGLNGVLYTVKKGDTLSIVAKKTNANEFDIAELNELSSPNYSLVEGSQIFIPNGVIVISRPAGVQVGTYIKFADPGMEIPPGTFINPLIHCSGYNISRGVSAWHTGVDMAKPGGCWINASAPGTVSLAGWTRGGGGFCVNINHNNGFVSIYCHGNGDFAVKAGDVVAAGQKIMYMGQTGMATGIHLHFEIHYNGAIVDPMKYVQL